MTTLTRPSLADELLGILQFHVGAKFRREPTRIDITHGVTRSVNADIRRIDQDGIDIFFDRACDHVRWPDIVEIKAFALDPETREPVACRTFDKTAILEAMQERRAGEGEGM